MVRAVDTLKDKFHLHAVFWWLVCRSSSRPCSTNDDIYTTEMSNGRQSLPATPRGRLTNHAPYWILNVSVRLSSVINSSTETALHLANKCIWDDTKAAARRSLNCIRKNKIKYGEKRFSIWPMEFLHLAMWHVALESWQWIHQVAAPCNVICGSGMTCHWICPNVRHIGIYVSFPFPHITVVDMSFCTSLRNFNQIGPPSAEINDVMSIFKMADLSHLGF